MSNATLPHKVQPMLLTVDETATALNVSRCTVYALMKSGALRGIKVGGSRRFALSDVEAYIDGLLNEAAAAVGA